MQLVVEIKTCFTSEMVLQTEFIIVQSKTWFNHLQSIGNFNYVLRTDVIQKKINFRYVRLSSQVHYKICI